jgi:mono/diheme cytochrome c family protein
MPRMSHVRAVLSALLTTSAVIFLVAASIASEERRQGVPADADAQTTRTVQDGVFSDAQATRGQALYAQRCAGCHGPGLMGGAQAPPLDGPAFRYKWRQEPLSALFIKIRYTMPPVAPPNAPPTTAADAARLTAEQGADLVAHILKSNRFPAGKADFAAADAATSSIGWPPAPAGEEPPNVAARYPPTGTLNQLMRGIFFHNSNLIFAVQEVDPKDLPGQPSADKPGGITIFDVGLMSYTGWQAIEHAATAVADASTLLMQPGLRCDNGRLAPITEPDWIRFTDRTIAAARRSYRLAQMRDKEALSEFTLELSNSCNACHQVYRDVGGRGRGRGANPGAGGGGARCVHR